MRLIDADALTKEINENPELFEKERVYLEGIVLNAPTIIADNYSMGYQDGIRKTLRFGLGVKIKEVMTMTIDEAIKHCEDKAIEQYGEASHLAKTKEPFWKYSKCCECAQDHEQLAEWLKELKAIQSNNEYKDGHILKRMTGDYVTYKIDYLLDHLSREVSLLESYWRWKEQRGDGNDK